MTQVLTAIASVAGYGVFVLTWPSRGCRTCGGWGRKARRRRPSACGKCGGTGRQFRPGARLVHRGAAMVMRYVREKLEGER